MSDYVLALGAAAEVRNNVFKTHGLQGYQVQFSDLSACSSRYSLKSGNSSDSREFRRVVYNAIQKYHPSLESQKLRAAVN